ncbi:MAG TPA: M20/M25/M40 family metallo-hydrolase [Pyrinomonadaceae bacterium]|nr:M20/M25/M40 family metallo-hydrolase [Pyrinomonadaceae bacterium]
MRALMIFLTIISACWPLSGQSTRQKVREFRQANEQQILREFLTLLSIPNVASNQADIRRNAAHIADMLQRRGFSPQLLETKDASGPPVVYSEWKVPGVKRTIVLYAHYDGQPTDPTQWTGSRPWEPTLRSAPLEAGARIIPTLDLVSGINPEWRLYARSAADDKAGVMAILAATDALKARGIAPTSNLKFVFEGEEEAGSPHLGEIIRRYADLLQADAWLICDGPVHQSGLKQVVFGVRGDTNVDVTLYGAKRPLHSGHYGNWAPNPALLLAQLLSSMKDRNGRVLIAGWYDDVIRIGSAEQRALSDAPEYDERLKRELGLVRTDNAAKSLLELLNEPSLNINGMSSGDTGALARNVIPTTATAVLDLRLVSGNDYKRQVEKLREHIRKEGFYVLEDREPTDEERLKYPLIARVGHRSGGYNAERTRMDLPISRAVIEAVESSSDKPVVKLPTAGGSLPLSIITENMRTVTITVPIANYDNNQHAENENLRLQNLWDGIETMAALMVMRPKVTTMQKTNIAEKLSLFGEYWKPHIAAELNGQQVKLVKFKGPFTWHHHEKEDELFLVVKGSFRLEFCEDGNEREVKLEEGEMIVVPRGIEHRPVADEECHVLLFEPVSTLNTGNVENELTTRNLPKI